MKEFKLIAEKDLPLTFIGEEKGSHEHVFGLTGLLSASIHHGLKAYGYRHRHEVELTNGRRVAQCWSKR